MKTLLPGVVGVLVLLGLPARAGITSDCQPEQPPSLSGGLGSTCCGATLSNFNVDVLDLEPCGCVMKVSGTVDPGLGVVTAYLHSNGSTLLLGQLSGDFNFNAGCNGCSQGNIECCTSATVTCGETVCRLYKICLTCVPCG